MSEIKVVLPQKYDLVTGDTFQLFYQGIIDAPNPFCYDILAVCEKGKNFPRYFEFTPEEAGEYELTISVFGPAKVLLGEATTHLCVKQPRQPKKPLNILCIGDSITAGGEWVTEASRRLTGTGGTPDGLALAGISFIGTCGEGTVCYEGYGGWRWESYFPSQVGSMWVVCNTHNKVSEDQHSLWQDESGNIWQLETLAGDYLKFNRYMQHDGARPETGTLTHYKNATHQEPIQIEKSSQERLSPFYDSETKSINLNAYCKCNGFSGIDAVYILLGTNGFAEAYAAGIPVREHCRNLVAKGKELVALIRSSYKNAKIRIMGLHMPSLNGGTGANYGAVMPYCDDYGLVHFIMELNQAYEAWTLEPAYRDFMEFINVSGQFDAENNMPCVEKPVNVRSTKTERIGSNGVHPLYEGYMQIADAAFRSMVHLCYEF
ncbi:MAG: hypothetical protein IKL80_04955 [Clostridia bacterium]|nr:hypothetical protein [Clostridia bacterium]